MLKTTKMKCTRCDAKLIEPSYFHGKVVCSKCFYILKCENRYLTHKELSEVSKKRVSTILKTNHKKKLERIKKSKTTHL